MGLNVIFSEIINITAKISRSKRSNSPYLQIEELMKHTMTKVFEKGSEVREG